MNIGIPREIKQGEYRVAMVPADIDVLIRAGHKVRIEADAGRGSGICENACPIQPTAAIRVFSFGDKRHLSRESQKTFSEQTNVETDDRPQANGAEG